MDFDCKDDGFFGKCHSQIEQRASMQESSPIVLLILKAVNKLCRVEHLVFGNVKSIIPDKVKT